jgi:thiamine biosynthesis lipoprotein
VSSAVLAAPSPYTRAAPWTALGSYVELAVTRPDALTDAQRLLQAQLDELDRACSRFRTDSELARLHRDAGRPTAVSPLLREALQVALDAAARSSGLVDPTVGSDLVAAGYDRDFAAVRAGPDSECDPPQSAAAPAGRRFTWRDVVLDTVVGTVLLSRGCVLDLGATAKAYGADRAAASIAGVLDTGVLVSLGGDLATAGPVPAGRWPVRVAAERPDAGGETVLLAGGALATSSPGVRRWRRAGRELHHILDPRTGQPAPMVWRSVTVAAAGCVEANTAATAAVVLGACAPEVLQRRGLPARLTAADGRVLRLCGWPPSAGEQP